MVGVVVGVKSVAFGFFPHEKIFFPMPFISFPRHEISIFSLVITQRSSQTDTLTIKESNFREFKCIGVQTPKNWFASPSIFLYLVNY